MIIAAIIYISIIDIAATIFPVHSFQIATNFIWDLVTSYTESLHCALLWPLCPKAVVPMDL